jgi:hypothetical protein
VVDVVVDVEVVVVGSSVVVEVVVVGSSVVVEVVVLEVEVLVLVDVEVVVVEVVLVDGCCLNACIPSKLQAIPPQLASRPTCVGLERLIKSPNPRRPFVFNPHV